MRTVIIEDEPLATKNLTAILDKIGDIEILECLDSVAESVEWFKNNELPDLIFMDIHLADGSAFEIFNQVDIKCPVIFTTAYDEFAIKAFKVNSIDYLLKPINITDVQQALAKYKSLVPTDNFSKEVKSIFNNLIHQATYHTNLLLITKGEKLIPLPVQDIAYIYIDNGIVKAVTFENKSFVLSETLDEVERELSPVNFYRANRQYIISREAIKDIDFWFNTRLVVNLTIKTPERITISKQKNSKFREWLSSSF